jgi:hypothetical protein
MFGRDILEKDSLISQLKSMELRREKHGDTFDFDAYLGLTFASHGLVDDLAALVQSNDQAGFAARMDMFQDRFRSAPGRIRKALTHYLGRRHGKLESFDDLPELLKRLG